MRILITNDDGYRSEGIRTLLRAAEKIGEVIVVAPEDQQSTMSNALTLYTPIQCKRIQGGFIVGGTPADSVIMATNQLIEGEIDLCLSGVNHGANLGEDVLYSGTVAAAMEAAFAGIPSVAISHVGAVMEEISQWTEKLCELISKMLEGDVLKKGLLYNVNLPEGLPSQVKGVRMTSLGSRRYTNSIRKTTSYDGTDCYEIGNGNLSWTGSPEADYRAVKAGYISVTPIKLDLTDYAALEGIEEW